MIGKVAHPDRVLNTHYQQPPELNSVELMSCGQTDDGVIDAPDEMWLRGVLEATDGPPERAQREGAIDGAVPSRPLRSWPASKART